MTMTDLSEYAVHMQQKQFFSHSGYNGVTLLFVIKGAVNIVNEERYTALSTNDIFLINKNSAYEIESKQPNTIITLEISNHYFSRYYKPYFYHQYCIHPAQESTFKKKYTNSIKVLLAKIMLANIQGCDKSSLKINRSLSEILLILVTLFQEKKTPSYKQNIDYNPKIKNILYFIEKNYNLNISLQKIAQNEHVSPSYLSRMFKKEVGIGFVQYLTKTKFEHAFYDLINTPKPIYQITEEHGFSNSKQFINLFKKNYQSTPNQFRTEYKKKPQNSFLAKGYPFLKTVEPNITQEANLSEIIPLLSNLINNATHQIYQREDYSNREELVIDLEKQKKAVPLSYLNYIVTIGELNELLKENVRQQILMMKKESRIDFVEVYHLISGDTILPDFTTDESISTLSPYSNSDLAISFLKQNDIALFMRIHHRSVIKNPKLYACKLVSFFNHCVNVYGLPYVQRWHFIYYIENKNILSTSEFSSIYLLIRKTIKLYLPEAKLGFYYPFFDDDNGKADPLFKTEIVKNIDFLGYSANYTHILDKDQADHNTVTDEMVYVLEKTRQIKKCLKFHDISIPLTLMKWNTLTGNTLLTNGSFFRGALIFHTLFNLSAEIDSIGISLNTDVQLDILSNSIDITGIALFFIFNTKRPIFYVLKLMEKLQGQVIAVSDDYVVTKTYFGYQIVLTNVAIFHPSLSIQDHITENFKKKKVITLKGIPCGEYQIKRYIFDQQHGASYKQYEQFQTKYGRDQEIFDYINRNTSPSLSVHDENVINNLWITLADLEVNAIHFYEIRTGMEK